MNVKKDRMDNIKIFALNSNPLLAKEVADLIGVTLGVSSSRQFSDGEIQMNIEESIRGKDIYIIQSTSEPASDYLMELLIMIDALKRASANTINIVMPYYGYARQDRKARSREPITAKLIANLIESAGAHRLITLELHAAQIQGFFNLPVDQLLTTNLQANYFKKKEFKEIVVVAPENAGIERSRRLADKLQAPLAFLDKQRTDYTKRPVQGITIIGEVKDKTCIIIDDMIDTARTITSGATALLENGAKEVYACCTHGVLSDPAIHRIRESGIKEVIITNSIHLPDDKKDSKIITLSIGPLLAQSIMRVQNNDSVSMLF